MTLQNQSQIFRNAEVSAERLIDILGIKEVPVNINLLLRFYKVTLELIDFHNSVFGYTSSSFDGKVWNVAIDEKLTYPEQRKVFLHEIFHIRNHENVSDSRGGIQQASEHAADQFAEAFLMPKKLFLENWEKVKDISILAKIFQVPVSSVENRLLTLGIIRD